MGHRIYLHPYLSDPFVQSSKIFIKNWDNVFEKTAAVISDS